MTLEEFLALPDEKPALELEPDGMVIQKMSPKGRHSRLQSWFLQLINSFAESRRLALAFPELRDIFGSAAYVPDVSVYVWDRIPRDQSGEVQDNFTEPPDIAIEIVSPGQSVNSVVRRSVWYVDNGVRVALVVDAEDRSVLVFRAGQPPTSARGADAIDVADMLPGFYLTADDVFTSLKI
jgi:Uma2 family endonuclease